MLETRKNLLTDDQRKAIEAKQNTDSEKERKLTEDLNEVFGTGAGMNVLRWLMDECGFLKSDIVYNKETSEIAHESSRYNMYRRTIYLQIRRRLKPSITGPVENLGLAVDEKPIDLLS